MGCCISKCKPKKHYSIQDYSNYVVQDKLVIAQQAPRTPKVTQINPSYSSSSSSSLSNKISPCPASPATSSASSVSSFTCTSNTNTSTINSCSSLSSASPSILTSKDRSFSNEFLWSCVKENPHIIRVNSIKDYSQLHVPSNVHVRKLDPPVKQAAPPLKQAIPQKINASTPQKRVRSNSPAPINRQKSFRREPERSGYNSVQHCRTLGSPSPSRRFTNGDSTGRKILTSTTKESCSKRMASNLKVNAANNNNSHYHVSSFLRKENLIKPVNPYTNNVKNSSHQNLRSCLKNVNKETCIHRISSKIDEVAVEEAVTQQDSSEAIFMVEDVDNPLISLDCFIFL